MGARGRGYDLVVEDGAGSVTHPLAFAGVARDIDTRRERTTKTAETMLGPRLTRTPWGLAVGDGLTGRAAVLREGALAPLPWRFPASNDMELVVLAAGSGHIVVSRRAGRDGVVWYITEDEVRVLVADAHGAWAAGVDEDVALVYTNGEVFAFRLSSGAELARVRAEGVLTGVAGAAGCLVLGTASGVLEVRCNGASLEARHLVALRRHDVIGRFAAKLDEAEHPRLMKGLTGQLETAQDADGASVVTLGAVDSSMIEEAKARLVAAGALSVAVKDAPP